MAGAYRHILSTFSACLAIYCIDSRGLHGQHVLPHVALVRIVPHLQLPHISKCLFIQYVIVLAYLGISHIRVYGFQVSRISECMVSKCLAYLSVWFPSVSHIRVLSVQMSHISECRASKCLTYPSAERPNVSHIRVLSVQMSHISEC